MDIVSKNAPKVKGGKRWIVADKVNREYTLIEGDLGVQVKRERLNIWGGSRPLPCGVRKQGDITTFSENSRARLRVTLATACWRGGGDVRRLGITLTLPWAATSDEWRKVWHDFATHAFARRCKSASMVWRIELTTGEAEKSGGLRRAHVHAVVWLPVDKPIDNTFKVEWGEMSRELRSSLNARAIAQEWISTWSKCAPALTRRQWRFAQSVGFAAGHGVVLKWLDDTPHGAIHYLCDHATKHKDAQLGWVGRQWGVVNRANLEWPKDGDKLDGALWVIIQRHLRRLNESRVREARRLVREGLQPLAARSLAGYLVPVGDNKCWFGATKRTLDRLISAALAGFIAPIVPRGTIVKQA